MSPAAVRTHRTSRIAVWSLLLLFFVFGGSFVPQSPFPAASKSELASRTLTGSEASRFLRDWKTNDPKAAIAIGRARIGSGAGQVVVLTSRKAQLPAGLFRWLAGAFSASADEYYTDGGVMVITPFEDADPNIAAFDIYYADSESGTSYGGTARIDTTEAAYGDPDEAIEITAPWTNCAIAAPAESLWARAWRSWTGSVSAQTSHKGGPCGNMSHMDEVSKQNLKDGLKNALLAAGAAAIPCIFTTVGWAVCVGGAAIGAAAVSLGWDAATMLWDCRCTWFGIGCGEEEWPPPV